MTADFRFKTEEEKNLYSDRITWEEAVPLMADYYQRPDALRVVLPNGTITKLKGLRFEAADIQSLLDQDGVTDIYFMFANSPTDPKNITIIASGVVDPEGNGGEILKEMLFDYCEPCPSKCPTNM
jgi:hypothetical protein